MIGSEEEEINVYLQRLFTSPTFRAYTCGDLAGMEWGGAIKNVFAIASGIATGLGLGDNATAGLVTRGLAEMIRLGTALRGKPDTFIGLSGVGDLIATCYSQHSRNFRAGMEMANLGIAVPDVEDGSGLAAWADHAIDPAVTLADVEWLASLTGLPVVVKGVLRGDDAKAAVDSGATAVAVSNHGGRQLDTSVATADALLDVVSAVAGRAEVYVDGGIRRGTDVVKALALGARAVLIGRPFLWGLATDGAAGVEAVLAGLREEVRRAFALCGAASVDDVTFDLLA